MKHIDDWIDEPAADEGEALAKVFFRKARRPAIEQLDNWRVTHPLFCTYEGSRYRVTGASRMGDVWLAADLARVNGYDKRVDVEKCSNWSGEP